MASDMKSLQLFADASEEWPDMVSLVGNSVTRQVWGNFMSDAKNLTGNSLLPKENIYCNQKGKFYVRFHTFDRKSPYFQKISCQMPEAYFWHEISPLLKTNMYIAVQMGKFHVRCQKLNSDIKFPHF